MNSEVPKPYMMLDGETILYRTLSSFAGIPGLQQVVVSTSQKYSGKTSAMLNELFPEIRTNIVEGGERRQDSIQNALNLLDKNVELVAVHDAVRPFVKRQTILNALREASEYGGAVVGVPVKDTIKKIDDSHFVKSTPERSELWQAQTPQVFRYELICRAYALAELEQRTGTDDSSLVEASGGVVKLVEGGRDNFKITYPIDFEIAKLLISNKRAGQKI